MSKIVINNLPINKQLDRQALADFNGGINPSSLLAQIKAESTGAASEFRLNQEPELGVSPTLSGFASLANPRFIPHS